MERADWPIRASRGDGRGCSVRARARTLTTLPAVVHLPGPTMKLTSCDTVACVGGAAATLTLVPMARLMESAMAEESTAATAAMMELSESAGVVVASGASSV